MKSGVVKGYSGQLYRATTTYNIPLLIWGWFKYKDRHILHTPCIHSRPVIRTCCVDWLYPYLWNFDTVLYQELHQYNMDAKILYSLYIIIQTITILMIDWLMFNTNVSSISAMSCLSLILRKVNTCHWEAWLLYQQIDTKHVGGAQPQKEV